MTSSRRINRPTAVLTAAIGGAGLFGLLTAVLIIIGVGGSPNAGARASVRHRAATTTTTTAPAFVAQTSTVPQSTASDGTTDCGGVTMLKPDGTPWTCTFDDEFDGATLNTDKWTVETTATNGYHSGNECYENSPNNVSVSGGTLNLTVRKEAAPFTCASPLGNYSTQYTAGMVDSDPQFSQTYGDFEVKAKFPAATVKGLQTSLWLWPDNAQRYGSTWPASGEIDFTEWYSEFSTLGIPYIHYDAAATDPDVTNRACNVANTNEYNTYGVIWTAQSLTIQMDGQTCLVDDWNPASPEVKPDPFNMPFFINLTAALGIGTNAFEAGTTPLPATSQIDWVRVWS